MATICTDIELDPWFEAWLSDWGTRSSVLLAAIGVAGYIGIPLGYGLERHAASEEIFSRGRLVFILSEEV